MAACVTPPPPAPKGAVPADVFRRGTGREQWQAGYVFIGGSTPLPACAAAEPASAGISGGGGGREIGGGAKTPVGYAASGQPRGALGTENGEGGNWVAGAASVCPTNNVCSGKGGDFGTPFVCTRGDHAGGLPVSGPQQFFLETRAWHWGLPSIKWQICYLFALRQNVGASSGSDCEP